MAHPQLAYHLPSQLEQLQLDLLCGYHILDMNGQGADLAAHMTARMPGEMSFWTHPFGLAFDEVALDDLQEADFKLNVLQGDRPINLSMAFHVAIYRARPDVSCVVHTHPTHSVALGVLGRNLDIITQDGAKLLDDVALYEGYQGTVVGEDGEAKDIARTLGSRSALLLKHHGIIAVGKSVRDAVLVAMDLEAAASVQLLAMASGTPHAVPGDGGRQIKEFLWRDPVLRGRWDIYVRRARRLRPELIPPSALREFPPLVHP